MIDPLDFKILICDDSPLARKKIKDSLAFFGYRNIVESKDGKEAIEYCKEHQPNLIFMDIVMPNTYGIDALKAIKEIQPLVPVVMVSSTGTKANINEAVHNGADDFLIKPFTNTQIQTILKRINPT